MASRRPRLSGIACLQCETRLLQSSAHRRFSRFSRLATTAPSLPSNAARPTAASIPKRESPSNASRYLHGAGIGLGQQAEALAAASENNTKSTEAGDGSAGKRRVGGKSPLSDLVADDVLIDDGLVEEPLLDEAVSKVQAEEIWTSLLGDEGEPTEHDIFGYIDELQPTDQVILPQAVFEDIAHSLGEGFTTSQLVSYVRKNRKPTTARTVYAWESKRRPWVPELSGSSSSNHYAALYGNGGEEAASDGNRNRIVEAKAKAIGPGSAMLLQGYITPSMTNKEKVVAQLMRECWGVAISEVVESPGRLVVEVREMEYTLLEGGAHTWVRDIAAAFSTVTTTTATASKSSSRSTSRGQTRQSRRIELHAEKRLLRVHAPQSVADAMLAEIDQVLKSAATKRFSLSDVARRGAVVSEPALKAVGALTGSWVRQEKQEIVVSWVTPRGAAGSRKALEDTGDVVYRLLLHTFGPSAVVTAPKVEETAMPTHGGNSLYLDHRPLKRSKGRFLAYENNAVHNSKLGWHDRLGKWARWVEPMLRAQTMEAERYAKLKVAPGVWSLPFDFTAANETGEKDKEGKKWYETLNCSTVSAFGRVLHEQDHDAKLPVYGVGGTVPPAEPAARVPDVRRVFSAVAPPLLGIKLDGAGEGDTTTTSTTSTTSTTTVLRFLPGTTASTVDARAPSLEVVLESAGAEEGQRPVLSCLRVVAEFSVCDTLFPTQMVDVRTTQKRFFELPAADILAGTVAGTDPVTIANAMAPLRTFLEQSVLELRNDSHSIATPRQLHQLGLPRAVLGSKTGAAAGAASSSVSSSASDGETVYVDYTFAGAEVRRRVATPYQGWTLGLTNVQTGPGQARWTELSLEAVPTGGAIAANRAKTSEEVKESFRDTVGSLVHGDAIQWQLPIGQVLA